MDYVAMYHRLKADLDAQGKALIKDIDAKRVPDKAAYDAYSAAYTRWIYVRMLVQERRPAQLPLL